MYTYTPSLMDLIHPASHPSRSPQSTELSSLCYTAASYKLSILHVLVCISSVQFSHSVMSDSLRPHELQHTRPPCPLPTPRVHSNSHPLSRWFHPAVLFSVAPFSSCPQSLPASESFTMSQLFAWGGQGIAVSALPLSFQRTPRTDLL